MTTPGLRRRGASGPPPGEAGGATSGEEAGVAAGEDAGGTAGATPAPSSWVNRVARIAVRPLAETALTPNHLTTLRLLTGLGAAAAFAAGTRGGEVWGGVLFVLSAFLDRADGELARLSGRTTPGGHVYDLASDAASNVLAFVGIGVGLRGGPVGSWSVALGLLAGLAVGAVFWMVARVEGRGEERLYWGRGPFDPDDALLLLGPVAWLGALWPLLVAAAAGAPLFAAWQLHAQRHRLFHR